MVSNVEAQGTLDPNSVVDVQEQLVSLIEKAAEGNKPFYVVSVRPDVVIIDDLRQGAVQGVSTGRALRLLPGQPLNLLRFFEQRQVVGSMNLAAAFAQEWVQLVQSAEPVLVQAKAYWVKEDGVYEAPPNEFDEALAELIEKDQAEEDKLRKSSRDPLSARVRRTRPAE